MPRKWFIKTKAGPQGPVDCKTLVRLANMGKLKSNTPVSHDGDSWIKAKTIPELSFLAEQTGEKEEPKWYVLTKHGNAGPFRLRKLQKLAEQGRVQPNLAVSRDRENWIKAKRVPGIVFSESRIEADATPSNDLDIFILDPSFTIRQLDFSFLSNDELKRARQQAVRPKQSTMFGVDPESSTPHHPDAGLNDECPLFCWPPTIAQLSLLEYLERIQIECLPLRQLALSLLKHDGTPFLSIGEPLRQLMLFTGIQPAPRPERPSMTGENEFRPLLHWPPRFIQLDLLDWAEAQQRANHRDESSQPARQLKLTLLDGDQWRREPVQLTLFSVGPTIHPSTPMARRSLEAWPLFHWPPSSVQLRLFDGKDAGLESTADQRAMDTKPSKATEPVVPPAEVPAASDTVRWLHEEWRQTRQSAYIHRFGPPSHIARPQDPGGVPLEIHVFPPVGPRPITTLVTSGMSNFAMPVPSGKWSPRAELILYVDEPKTEYINLLYFLAQIPLQQHKTLRYGTACGHGNPPQAILPGSVLDGYVFMLPAVTSDFEIHQSTQIGDDSLHLLWVVPTTAAERHLLATQGMEPFCRLLDQNKHPLVLDPDRSCYVSGANSIAG